jgi:type I restriction enzyme S subunit
MDVTLEKSKKVPLIRFAGFTDSWEQRKLGEIGVVIDPHPSHRAPKEVRGGIPFIGIGDVDEMGNINKTTARPVDPSVYDEHHRRYDLAIPSLGLGRVASLGKVIRLRNDLGKYAVSPTMSVLQFHDGFDVDYLYAFMNSEMFQKPFEDRSNGSTRQSVGTEAVRLMAISLPKSLAEQKTLGLFFARIDSAIVLHQRKLDELQRLKKSLLQKMFPSSGEDRPLIRFAGFTDSWEQRKLGEIGVVIDPHPSHRAPKEVRGGIPFIGIGDVDEMGNINKTTARPVDPSVYDEHHRRYDLAIPSLGLGRVASLGKVIRLRNDLGKYAVSPTMSVLQFHDGFDVDYLYAFMNSEMFQKPFEDRSNGSTRQSVGTEAVRLMAISLPKSLAEQKTLGLFFARIDSAIVLHQRKLDELQRLKKSLLQKMFI